MAGKPLTRIKKLAASLTEALASGRQEEAPLILAELRRVATDAGLPLPELPPEASEMWVTITERSPTPAGYVPPREAKLSDETRLALTQAGDLAAQHVLALMQAPGLFGPYGVLPVEKQVPALQLVMSRAFGQMPLGAQRVAIEPCGLEPEEPGDIRTQLSMMIRKAQAERALEPRNITPADARSDDAA